MSTSSGKESFDLDLVVIGAGSGGLATAKRAASYGARVAIVEDDRVGGTCVIRGCIPKKLMVYAADMHGVLADATGYGWSCGSAELSWPRLVARRDEAVAGLERAHEGHLERAGVELVRGRATVVGPGEVSVGEKTLRSRYILIATGAAPVLPPVEGIENAITSDGFFELAEQPKHVAIVGGGYIAVELASILRGVGTDVTLIIRRDLPLRGFDEELRRELHDALLAQGVDVRAGSTVSRIERVDGQARVQLDTPEGAAELVADQALLYAVGRAPNTAGLGLAEIGVPLDERGAVVSDEDGSTPVPSILAVGDVTGRIALTPVAIQAGRAIADRVFGGKTTTMSYDGIPTAVFTEPPIGTVGLTEQQAEEHLGKERTRVYRSRFTPLSHMLTERKIATLVKMIVDEETDRVVGCHMIGHDAPEIIQGIAVAMKAGATKADFDATVGIHPSSAEEFVTLI